MNNIIQVKNLHKDFDENPVLKNVSIKVSEGEIIVSGKPHVP